MEVTVYGSADGRCAIHLQLRAYKDVSSHCSRLRRKSLHLIWPIVERCRIKIGAVRPNQGMHFGINSHLIKQDGISKRPIKFPDQNRLKVDHLLRFVVKPHAEGVRPDQLERSHAVDRMSCHLQPSRGSIGKGVCPAYNRAQSAICIRTMIPKKRLSSGIASFYQRCELAPTGCPSSARIRPPRAGWRMRRWRINVVSDKGLRERPPTRQAFRRPGSGDTAALRQELAPRQAWRRLLAQRNPFVYLRLIGFGQFAKQ
jgi:hypothetical protein